MNIGDKVSFSKSYSRKVGDRFKSPTYDLKTFNLIPRGELGTGFIIGLRRVIMADYKYTPPRQCGDNEWSQPYSSGTYEEVLLVTTHLRREPFLVRKIDLLNGNTFSEATNK